MRRIFPTLTKPLPMAVFAIAGLLALFITIHSARAEWIDPTQPPTGGNVSAPLNVSSLHQIKEGDLTIRSALLSVENGNFFVETDNKGIFWGDIEDPALPHIEYSATGILYISPGDSGTIHLQKDTIVEGLYNLEVQNGSIITGGNMCFGGDCISGWGDIGGGGSVVTSLNSMNNDITIVGQNPVSVASGGGTITISCPGCGGGGDSLWTEGGGGTFIYPDDVSDDVYIGGNSEASSKFLFRPTLAVPLFEIDGRLNIAENADDSPGFPPLTKISNSGTNTRTLEVYGNTASPGTTTQNIFFRGYGTTDNDDTPPGPGENYVNVNDENQKEVLRVVNDTGLSAVFDHDVRILEGELKVDTATDSVAPLNGDDIRYGVWLTTGARSDIASFCEVIPGLGGDCADNDALYIQNNGQPLYFSPDSGSGIGNVGIGTTALDEGYKLTIETGGIDHNAVKILGMVDVQRSGDIDDSGTGSIYAVDDITAGRNLCIGSTCIDEAKLIDIINDTGG